MLCPASYHYSHEGSVRAMFTAAYSEVKERFCELKRKKAKIVKVWKKRQKKEHFTARFHDKPLLAMRGYQHGSVASLTSQHDFMSHSGCYGTADLWNWLSVKSDWLDASCASFKKWKLAMSYFFELLLLWLELLLESAVCCNFILFTT